MFRFRRVVDLVQTSGRAPDWARSRGVAATYDQSHFNREFREFAGMSPGEFAPPTRPTALTVVVG